jgi:hypothetical protein
LILTPKGTIARIASQERAHAGNVGTGLFFTIVDGTPFDPYTPDAVASNGPLQPLLLEALRGEPR